ncbi:MAG: response regulator [Candidatus Microgenomates bacterium]|jgi:two-component system chemotaxis sensor kinase CheA
MDNKKILVVEDDQNTRNLYQRVLESAGFKVDVATDGAEGLTKCREGGYDLVLLDIMLPKMDGIVLLGELKKSPPKVPNKNIYMLTNLAHDPILKEAITLGAKDVLLKTDVNPEELVNKVKEILSVG